MEDKRRRLVGALIRALTISSVVVAAVLIGLGKPIATLAACSSYSGHSYAYVQSGTGSNVIGTGAWTTTWPSGYSIRNNGINFSDEAQWVDGPPGGIDLEGGFFSGAGHNVAWTDGLMPYYTLDTWQSEVDDAGNFLQYNNKIWLNTTEAYGANGAFIQVGQYDMYPGNVSVGSPVQNYAQGEVYDTNDYHVLMGGSTTSPGESFHEQWEDTSRNFYDWGFYGSCVDSGYGLSGNGTDTWNNWGGQNA